MARRHYLRHFTRLCSLTLGLWVAQRSAAASELSWSGPADCDQREQLVFQLERALSAPLAEVAAFHFQVHVERTSPESRARLLVRTSADAAVSERVLVAPSCSKLVDTLTVAMALALEAATSAQEPASPAAEVAPAEPSRVLQPPALGGERAADASGVTATPEDALTPLTWGATLWLTGDGGSLPAPGLGTALSIEAAWPGLELRALATLWFEQHAPLAGQPELGGDLALATGALLACTSAVRVGANSLALALCAGGELGRLAGSGTGVLNPRSGQSLWAAARTEADLVWRVPATRLALGAQLGLALPFVRDDFVLDGIGAVHRPASLAGRAGIGIGVAFE